MAEAHEQESVQQQIRSTQEQKAERNEVWRWLEMRNIKIPPKEERSENITNFVITLENWWMRTQRRDDERFKDIVEKLTYQKGILEEKMKQINKQLKETKTECQKLKNQCL